MASETSPILGLPIHAGPTSFQRVHFLDNLRTFLTILLIFHHSAMQAERGSMRWIPEYPTDAQLLPLALFITVNKSFLWSLFYFVSGYASHLALESSTDFQFLRSRVLKTALPMLIYLAVFRRALLVLLSAAGYEILFGSPKWPWAYAVLAGPGPYILVLLALDFAYLSIRWIGRQYPNLEVTHLTSKVKATLSTKFISTLILSLILVTGITFGNCLGLRLVPFIFKRHFPMDFPGYGGPVTFVIAYIAGINFHLVEKYLLIKSPANSVAALAASTILTYFSLFIAQWQSDAIWKFITPMLYQQSEGARWFVGGGFNLHTLFFTLWNPIIIYSLSISLISTFASTRPTVADWGQWSRNTVIAAYVHAIPIAVASHIDLKYGIISNLALRAIVYAVVGVVFSWTTTFILVKTWSKVKQIYNRTRNTTSNTGPIALPADVDESPAEAPASSE